MMNFENLCYREKVPLYTKLKPKPTEGRHLIRYKDEKDYDYYICDYCGDEIKILKKKIKHNNIEKNLNKKVKPKLI